MNCPYCNQAMEQGRIALRAPRLMDIAYMVWYAEKEFEKTGLLAKLLANRPFIGILNPADGYFKNSFYCPRCHKAFGEFPTDRNS